MSLDKASLSPRTQQHQQIERDNSHIYGHDLAQQYELDRQAWRQQIRSTTEDSAHSSSLFATALASNDAPMETEPEHAVSAKDTYIQLSSGCRGLSTKSDTSLTATESASDFYPELPNLHSFSSSMSRLSSMRPESVSPAASLRSLQSNYTLSSGPDRIAGGNICCDQSLSQNVQHRRASVAPPYLSTRDIYLAQQPSPKRGQQAQSQLLPSTFTTMRPESRPASPRRLSAASPRDRWPSKIKSASQSPVTLPPPHLSKSFVSPFSPTNGSMSASLSTILPLDQPFSRLPYQNREITHSYSDPLRQHTQQQFYIEDSPSLYPTDDSAEQAPKSIAETFAISRVSSNASTIGNPSPTNVLPPLLKHLEESSNVETCPPLRSSSFLRSSPTFSQLPPISHARYSSPVFADRQYCRREIAHSASFVEENGSHEGLGFNEHLPSASLKSYGGNRTSRTGFGGDDVTLESNGSRPGSAAHLAESPKHLPYQMATSPSSDPYILLPPLPIQHGPSSSKQLPTIKSLISPTPSPQSGETMLPRQYSQPRPLSQQTAQGLYQCQVPGCAAAPFPTQYLLNSHANVHSSNRPHYCPEPDCPRSKGGKGFKRKNEMIRHGLVHQSPGYVCPFCANRDHKYPRPDNLLRHVRVHHQERSKDDRLLREVLAQRANGPSRIRRSQRL